MKSPDHYLEYRQISHLFTAVELLPRGRARVIAGAYGETISTWEYSSITAALAAWFTWNPASGQEPAGYERRHIIKLNNEKLSPEREMVEDLIAVVTVFSARFHGLRSYKRTLEKAVEHADKQEDQA